MRVTSAQFSAAIAVGAVTASEEYRVLMEGCEILSALWYQLLVVVIAFGGLYALVAYALLAIGLRSATAPKSWLQTVLSVVLAFAFGGFALASASFTSAAASLVGFANSPIAASVADLVSYPNMAGAILGSFAFLLVLLSLQELKIRHQTQLTRPSEA